MKSRMEKRETGHKKEGSDPNKRKHIVIATVAVVAMIGIGTGAYIASINSTINEWNNKIYPKVIVQGIDVGGKSKEEATEVLQKEVASKINNKEIIIDVKDKDKKYEAKYSEIDPKYDIEKTVSEAFDYGKDLSIFKKNSLIKNKDGTSHDIQLNFSYSDKKLTELEDKVIKKLNIAPQNAKIDISNSGNISITPGKVGYGINKEDLNKELKAKINGNVGEVTKVEVVDKENKPKVTEEALSKINGVMGEFTTSFQSSDANRATNIDVSTEFVDGTLLMPGDVFSYSDISQTDKSRYKEGNVYINNKVEKDIGGGICQVSSTLYRAVMRANIRSTERHNHSLTVGYSKPSLDATVAWGYLDYKFKNPYDFPIYIQGITNNKNVTFKVYGDVKGLGGKTYDMTNEVIKTISPTEEIIKDPSLPRGTRIVESSGQTGYVSKGYQVTYENGKAINKELVSTDNYAMVPKKVRVGTK